MAVSFTSFLIAISICILDQVQSTPPPRTLLMDDTFFRIRYRYISYLATLFNALGLMVMSATLLYFDVDAIAPHASFKIQDGGIASVVVSNVFYWLAAGYYVNSLGGNLLSRFGWGKGAMLRQRGGVDLE